MAVVVVVVFVATLAPLVLFHRRRRATAQPSRKSSATIAESVYALVLVAIAIVFVTKTFRTESRVDAVAATGDTVEVVAFQWGWTFRHDGRTVTGDDLHNPTLVVKAGRTIRFRIISRDVIHSFWIPSERFKRDAFPQRWTRVRPDLRPAGHVRRALRRVLRPPARGHGLHGAGDDDDRRAASGACAFRPLEWAVVRPTTR